MTEIMDGQVSWFDADTESTKMSPELSVPTAAETFKQSSRRSSASQNQRLPMCLCLRRGDGASRDSSTMEWENGAWPGGLQMRSTTVLRNGEKDYAYWLTSTALQRGRFCLTLNLSERPRTDNPSRLSEILEANADPKYRLSPKACLGILNRAERRGKKLPEQLEAALMKQAGVGVFTSTQATCQSGASSVDSDESLAFQERAGKAGGGKGLLIQHEKTGALQARSQQNVYSLQGNTIDRNAKQNGSGISENVSHTLNAVDRHGIAKIGVDVYNGEITGDIAATVTASAGGGNHSGPKIMSDGFSFGQSEKARGIGYEEEVSPTLRGGEGGNQKPVALIAFAQNQRDEVRNLHDLAGALAAEPGAKQQTYVAAVDCRNGTENAEVNGTLQAQGSGVNLNNVIREERWENKS